MITRHAMNIIARLLFVWLISGFISVQAGHNNPNQRGAKKIASPSAPVHPLKTGTVNTMNNDFFLPPSGLEAFNGLYLTAQKNKQQQEITRLALDIYSTQGSPEMKPHKASFYLLAIIEYIKMIEATGELATENAAVIKDNLLLLKQLHDENIPRKIDPFFEIAQRVNVNITTRNIVDDSGETVRKFCINAPNDQTHTGVYFACIRDWLVGCLGLYELISQEFAENLTDCLKLLPQNMIEIGAGRGMLSAALAQAGSPVKLTSDIVKPARSWRQIVITAPCKADQLVTKVAERGIHAVYLAAQPCIGAVIDIINTGIPLLVLQTGYINISKLDIYQKQHKLKLLPLSIPGYAGLTKESCVRLLIINTSDAEADYYKGLIPAKYRQK